MISIQRQDSSLVNTADGAFSVKAILSVISKSISESNPMSVNCAGNSLSRRVHLLCTGGFILARNHTNARYVIVHSAIPLLLHVIDVYMHEKTPLSATVSFQQPRVGSWLE